MASTIKIKRSSVAAKVPTTADINTGELALNITDRKLYSSNGTTVFEIGTHKLSVSNAAATYQTKAIERAALANTNLAISNVKTGLTSTNTALRTLISDRLQVANAAALYTTKSNPTTSGLLAHTGRATISTNITVSGNTTLGAASKTITTTGLLAHTGRATISTNLAVSGNTTISGLIANGVLGTSNYVLRTNGTSTYWAPASAASPGLVSLTTVAVKDLTQNDNVVTAAQVVAAQSYLQVANAVATYQTKTVERAALANTNASIATQTSRVTLVNTNLTGTNTAIRTLVSDRLQVANASATYQTKATERAALANTNSYIRSQLANTNLAISNVKTGLTSTNTALRTLISDRLQVANAVALYTTKSNPTTSGLLAHTGRATISTNLAVSGNTTISGLIANGALGSSNYVLRTNGASVYWAPGGGSTTQYITVVNANALFATKAYAAANSYVKSVLANTNLRVNLINTNLTSTNTALRTLISDRLQVANAAATYQTKAVERAALANTNLRINLINTNLTSTNTAIRALDTAKLSVANAVAIYQTKAIERSALANTNLAITNVKTGLTTTNTALRTLISDRLQVANAATLYTTKSNPTTSGLLAHTGRATISTNFTVSGNTTLGAAGKTITSTGAASHTGTQTISTNLTVSGNTSTNKATVTSALTVSGNTTLGAASKTITTTGLLAHTGRATISTNLNVSGNTVIGKLVANGSLGASGYALKSNGSTVYWDAVSAGASPGLVSLTTVAVKDLTQNDNVVTAAQVVAAQSYLQVANAVALYTTKSNPTTSGLLAHTGRATISTNLTVSGNTTLGAASKTITTTGLLAHTGRATISTNFAVTGNTTISAATTSGNNATGALLVTGGIGVGDSLYVKSRIGIANTSSVSVVYMTYNNTTKSLDTTFG